MSDDHGRTDRHPLCTCPEVTFRGPAPDRSACAGGTVAHPVLTDNDMREIMREFRERMTQ